MNLVLNPAFKNLEPSLMKLPGLFDKHGKTIYKARNELRIIEVSGLILNVKRYRKPILLNRIAYTFFRKSKANRAYDYALILGEKGFGTPEPIAYLEVKSKGLLSHSYFVSKHIPEFRMMREFADASPITDREDIVVALGLFIARLHDAGILHLDLSIGNVLFQKKDGEIHFWLVDLNRMQFCNIDQEMGCKNFERLRGSDAFFQLLATTYATERGFDPTSCLNTILKYQKKSEQVFRFKSKRKKRLRKMKLRK